MFKSLNGNKNHFIVIVILSNSRCFGLLISPGRNVKQNDLHLIDMVISYISLSYVFKFRDYPAGT